MSAGCRIQVRPPRAFRGTAQLSPGYAVALPQKFAQLHLRPLPMEPIGRNWGLVCGFPVDGVWQFAKSNPALLFARALPCPSDNSMAQAGSFRPLCNSL